MSSCNRRHKRRATVRAVLLPDHVKLLQLVPLAGALVQGRGAALPLPPSLYRFRSAPVRASSCPMSPSAKCALRRLSLHSSSARRMRSSIIPVSFGMTTKLPRKHVRGYTC